MKQSTVEYRLSWQNPNEHLYDVEISFRAQQRETRLHLPAWRPGRYLIQNYAANVREWSAAGTRGRSLELVKTGKSTWKVSSERGERVRVRYRFFAGILDAGSSFLDGTEAYFNGTNLFMMIEGQRSNPVRLSVDAPKNWKAATQLPRKDDGSFAARDWDYLVDSPTVLSPTIVKQSFRLQNCEFTLAFQNAEGFDTKAFVAPVKAIARAHGQLFGGFPGQKYMFLYHYWNSWHGVEHEDSSSIILKRAEMLGAGPGSKAWDHALSITSHELFHVWNVKRILPRSFAPYDFSSETLTRLLWFMEGVTSYYGERMLRVAGLWSRERYLQHLAEEIERLESIPANRFLPLAQASWDAWLQEPAHMHDKDNAWISFYNKGEVAGAMLDLAMRRATKGRRSLDDLLRELWKRYGSRGIGLEEDAIERAAVKLAGPDMSEFFSRYIEGTDPLPYQEMFRWAGLDFRLGRRVEDGRSLGVKAGKGDGRLWARSVTTGSSAMRSGIMAGDEIIAVNGNRVTDEGAFSAIVSSVPRGTVVTVTTARGEMMVDRDVEVEADETIEVKLTPRSGDARQEKALRDWLGDAS